MIPLKHCGSCLLFDSNKTACSLYRTETKATNNACPNHTTILYECKYCHKQMIQPHLIDIDTEPPTFICENCEQILGTCKICGRGAYCALEQDKTIAEPLYVQVRRTQNNMTVQQTVINPKRIDLTCKKCSCWSVENQTCCRRDFNYCQNFVTHKV